MTERSPDATVALESDRTDRPHRLSRTEMEAFLARGITCRLGCLDDEGHPYVVPCWFEYADGGFYIIPRARSAWANYLQRNGRVSLCIDTEQTERVLVKGHAGVIEEPNVGGRWVAIARRMSERYMGERGPAYLEKTMHEPRWLFFVEPERITTWVGSWAERYKHSAW
ncbi:MAG: pyridoxamine 5'-phosphate oxidase family protein [Chloroflexi bacterium]|nr:pyridoxamine 5'-phosphate oxidase family protein [Chloroflexota bacterium]